MNRYSDYFTRIQELSEYHNIQPDYKKDMRTSATKQKECNLYADCFSNHTEYFNPNTHELTVLDKGSDRFISKDQITARFVNKYYELPELYNWLTDSKINYSDFCETINRDAYAADKHVDHINLGSNRIRYIIGDIGSGKSSFLTKLHSDLVTINERHTNNYYNIVVQIDCESILNYGKKPRDIQSGFFSALFGCLIAAASSSIPGIMRAQSIDFGHLNTDEFPLLKIKLLCEEVKACGARFTILIDNIDFYHYFYAKHAFFEEYTLQQAASVQDNIGYLIRTLSGPANTLGYCGLTVIMAIRASVWTDIVTANQDLKSEREFPEQPIGIRVPDSRVVLRSRINLYKEALEALRKRPSGLTPSINRLSGMIAELENASGRDDSATGRVLALGQHGFRSLVRFFSSLNLSYTEGELWERFLFNQSDILVSMYINDLRRRYYQGQKHFPNLFLVDAVINRDKDFPSAYGSHLPTYWLKYLILQLVSSGRAQSYKQLATLLVDDCQYEEFLVKLALGSLCTSNEFRCLELEDYDAGLEIERRRLKLTHRGNFLLAGYHGVPFCLSYRYLSSIIDDYMMSYPSTLVMQFYQPKLDFTHLYKLGQEYQTESIAFIKGRAMAVAYFVVCLEAGWRMELVKRGEHKWILDLQPNFSLAQRSLQDTLEILLSRFGDVNRDETGTEISKIFDDKHIWEQACEAFSECYVHNICVD